MAVEYLKNLHRMEETARVITMLGHHPYVPCRGFIAGIVYGDMEYEDYFNSNQEWLKKADALFVIDHSPGTDKEIAVATELGIPVYYSLRDLPIHRLGHSLGDLIGRRLSAELLSQIRDRLVHSAEFAEDVLRHVRGHGGMT
jgi:hypothetical protein